MAPGPVPAPTPEDLTARPGTVGRRPSRSPAYTGGGRAPGASFPPGPSASDRLELPPDFFAPPESSYWRETGFLTLPAAAGPTTILTRDVPDHSYAVCRDLTLQVNALLASDRITFRVRINGAPVSGWEVEVIPGNLAVLSLGFSADFAKIVIPGGSTLSVTASRTDAGSNTVGATAGGWEYARALQQQFYGGGA